MKLSLYKLKCILKISLCLALSISCSKDEKRQPVPKNPDLLEVAKDQGDLDLFIEAVHLAGVDSLFQKDNITIFAPTDSAFIFFLEGQGFSKISELYAFYGVESFQNFVLYHFLERKIKAAEVLSSYILTAATNKDGYKLNAFIARHDQKIILNSYVAMVTEYDIMAENGIIHKIDGVLSPLTLNGLIQVNPSLSKLHKAISKAQGSLEVVLNQENESYTILAPYDEAFTDFFNDNGYTDLDAVIDDIGQTAFSDLLQYHILKGNIRAEYFSNGSYFTLNGYSFEVSKDYSGTITITDVKGNTTAMITSTDFTAINGTIHLLDKVLECK